MIARIASYFIGMAIATSVLAADAVADDTRGVPQMSKHGIIRNDDADSAPDWCTGTSMQYCTSPRSQLTGGGTAAYEACIKDLDSRYPQGFIPTNEWVRCKAEELTRNITVDTHGITVPPRSQLTGDISNSPPPQDLRGPALTGDIDTKRDPSRCVFEIDGRSTIIGVHPVPCHINIPAPQDIVIEARPDPLDALKLNNSQFVH